MAPRISFSQTDIITAAINTVRDAGPNAITARNVARRLGGSTQPIYRSFASIDELVTATVREASRIAHQYCLDARDEESSFLAIGIGYLTFSRAEPELFSLLLTYGKAEWSPTSPHWPFRDLTRKMREDPVLATLSPRRLEILLRDMFIYTHGLSALHPAGLAANRLRQHGEPGIESDLDAESDFDAESDLHVERELLRETGGRLIVLAVMEERGDLNLEECTRRFHP